MNHLLAQIKKRGRGAKVFKILSNEEVYTLPNDLNNPKEYNSDYKLEDDEWFHIPNFSTTKYCLELLKKDFVSTDYNQITTEQLRKLNFISSYQFHDEIQYYFFQKINSSQFIQKKWFKLSNAPSLEKESSLIVINTLADAIYNKENDTLFFKKLSSISGIFNGISELYREATKVETEDFLKSDFINLKNDFDVNHVGIPNRKRIALAMETINKFEDDEKRQIYSYIKSYCENLEYDESESNFSIGDEEELKHLLWGIEQRYYTTLVGNEKRIANSVSAFNG